MIISAPSLEVTNGLLIRYQQFVPGATKEDLFRFLSAPSVERDIFLKKNCVSEFDRVGTIVIHRLHESD